MLEQCTDLYILGLQVLTNWIALEQYNGSLLDTFAAAQAQGPLLFILRNLPKPSVAATVGYATWILLQAALYNYLPGITCHGQKTPGGNLLSYTTNGLTAWFVTHVLFLTAAVLGRGEWLENFLGFLCVCDLWNLWECILSRAFLFLEGWGGEEEKIAPS